MIIQPDESDDGLDEEVSSGEEDDDDDDDDDDGAGEEEEEAAAADGGGQEAEQAAGNGHCCEGAGSHDGRHIKKKVRGGSARGVGSGHRGFVSLGGGAHVMVVQCRPKASAGGSLAHVAFTRVP